MARVAKQRTALRRQAWITAGGMFSLWLLAIFFAVAALWRVWHYGFSGPWLMLLGSSVTFFVLTYILTDRSLIPILGYKGERRVSEELTQLPDKYWILNDVQVDARGKTAQIDHVLVSPHGVWCIETKSRRGWIFGQRRDRTWTQVKRSERGITHNRQMENPVEQNEWQRSQLDAYLSERVDFWNPFECPIKCLVVLTAGTMMKGVQNVVCLPDVRREVQRVDTNERLNEGQVRRVLDALLQARMSRERR